MERISGRFSLGSIMSVCALAFVMLAAAMAPGAIAGKGPQVKLKVLTSSQKAVLGSGAVKVRVSAKAKTRVKLTAVKGRTGGIVSAKTAKFRKRGARTISLRLTRKGRTQLKACGTHTLTVRGTYRKSKGKRKAKATAKATRKLTRDRTRCGPHPEPKPVDPGVKPIHVDAPDADRCDPIAAGSGACLFPYPNDFYTVEDASSDTGRRLNLKLDSMPANAGGTHIDPSPINASDGFSPGSTLIVRIPGLDNAAALAQTGAVPINDIGQYLEADQEVVVIDTDTGERWPVWAEIDSNAPDPSQTTFQIHPAKNFKSGGHYVVGLRDLKTADGSNIEPSPVFAAYRDGVVTDNADVEKRRANMEANLTELTKAGIDRKELDLAWDFTVATDMNIAERALHIRDDAFAQLGDTDLADVEVPEDSDSPEFDIETVDRFTVVEQPEVARRVRGTFTVPCYLEPSCAPGGTFDLDAQGDPVHHGTWQANFDCVIPRAALEEPGRPAPYGHGLFGRAAEVFNSQKALANEHNFVLCATDEIGMSGSDVEPVAIPALADLSKFPPLADRLQQGLLNELFLGRMMIHPDGLISDPVFRVDEGDMGSDPVIDTDELFYFGSSQGGIMGGALTALSPDFTRAALGVPAMNYSVLLPRSVDFDTYAMVFNPSYPSAMDRALALVLVQSLWDRGEPNGYAHRMTDDPLPNTPPHEVLMNVSLGDHQVTNWQSNVEAWTIGATAHSPVLHEGRWPGVDLLYGVPKAVPGSGIEGSAVVYWDIGPIRPDPDNPGETIGTNPPPLENVPNLSGQDPHSAPRLSPLARTMVSDFLKPDGSVIDICDGPCFAGSFTGP